MEILKFLIVFLSIFVHCAEFGHVRTTVGRHHSHKNDHQHLKSHQHEGKRKSQQHADEGHERKNHHPIQLSKTEGEGHTHRGPHGTKRLRDRHKKKHYQLDFGVNFKGRNLSMKQNGPGKKDKKLAKKKSRGAHTHGHNHAEKNAVMGRRFGGSHRRSKHKPGTGHRIKSGHHQDSEGHHKKNKHHHHHHLNASTTPAPSDLGEEEPEDPTPPPPTAAELSRCEVDGEVAIRNNCEVYQYCEKTEVGWTITQFSCPSGMEFHHLDRKCINEGNAKCNSSQVCPQDDTYYPAQPHDDPQRYLKCIDGVPWPRSCENGKIWNNTSKLCSPKITPSKR